MLKNKKVAALLIAIQSMAFLPAVQVNAADLSKVKSQNGEINDAVAFKDGTSCISGNIDGLGNGTFILSNGNFNKLNNINSDSDINFYGDKYADVHDGQSFIDLSNGAVVSNNVKKSDDDSASSKLMNNMKNDNQGRIAKEELSSPKSLKELPKNKGLDSWYKSSYSLVETSTIINGGCRETAVYSDSNGNYIDADYSLGQVTVGLDNGKNVTISNTHDKVEDIIASISNCEVIGQDSKNIYRLAEITVKLDAVDGTIVSINGIKIDSNTTGLLLGDSGRTITFDVIQALSKEANGERVLGIRYPKRVNNYLIGSNAGAKFDILKNSADGFTICNGKLINYRISGAFIEAEAIELKNGSNNFNYIEVNNKSSLKINNKDTGYDFDINGTLFVLSDNNIYKFNAGKGFEKIGSVDRNYSNISIYDENNIVVWNKEEKQFAIVGGNNSNLNISAKSTVNEESAKEEISNEENTNVKSDVDSNKTEQDVNAQKNEEIAEDNNEKNDVSQSVKDGWINNNGKWNYYKSGTLSTGWLSIDDKWYYFETDGTMITGWKNINNIWYHFDEKGSMSIGWTQVNGDWYYFNNKGEMLTNTVVNGYLVSFDGKMLSL